MHTRKIQLVAVLLTVSALVGCGKAAAPDNVEPADHKVPYLLTTHRQVLPMDKVNPTTAPAVGVVVDGRVYPKGQAPVAPSPTPTPLAPIAGHGHLHLVIDLAGKQAFVSTIKLSIAPLANGVLGKEAFGQEFAESDFVGKSLDATAVNLDPGSYGITVKTLNGNGQVISTFTDTVTVEEGQTVSSEL